MSDGVKERPGRDRAAAAKWQGLRQLRHAGGLAGALREMPGEVVNAPPPKAAEARRRSVAALSSMLSAPGEQAAQKVEEQLATTATASAVTMPRPLAEAELDIESGESDDDDTLRSPLHASDLLPTPCRVRGGSDTGNAAGSSPSATVPLPLPVQTRVLARAAQRPERAMGLALPTRPGKNDVDEPSPEACSSASAAVSPRAPAPASLYV
jgi:hypothetical protein